MSDRGIAHRGVGRAGGEDRVKQAIKNAVESPLLETSISGAKAVLLNVMGGYDLSILEVNDAADYIHQSAEEDAIIIFGCSIKEELANEIVVTVIATGFEEAKGIKASDAAIAEGDGHGDQPAVQPSGIGMTYNPDNDFDIPKFLKNKDLNI